MRSLVRWSDPLSVDKSTHRPLSVHVDGGLRGALSPHVAKLKTSHLDGCQHAKPIEIVTKRVVSEAMSNCPFYSLLSNVARGAS